MFSLLNPKTAKTVPACKLSVSSKLISTRTPLPLVRHGAYLESCAFLSVTKSNPNRPDLLLWTNVNASSRNLKSRFCKNSRFCSQKNNTDFLPRSPPNWKTVILPPIFRISWEFKPRENFIICVDLQASSALADQVFTVTTFTRDRIQGKGWLFNKIYVQITLNVHIKFTATE